MRLWFVQLVWKEYREQRAFWLAMTCLALAGQAAVRLWPAADSHRSVWLVWLALGVPALYAAGSGATLFAVEHERRTFGFLRAFPIGARQLAAAKTFWSLASLLAMQAVLWCAAGAIAGGRFLPLTDHRPELALFGLAGLEGLAWGIACSLLVRDPLKSAVAAIFTATLAIHVATWIVDRRTTFAFDTDLYVAAIPYRLFFLTLVVAIDYWLLPRWLAERIPLARQAGRSRRLAGPRSPGAAGMFRVGRQLAHLAWQTWREARSMVWLLAAIGLALVLILGRSSNSFSNRMAILIVAVGLIVTLGGTFVFRADQRLHSRRFLAQRGVSPALVWLSRQSVWIAILAVWASAVLAFPLANSVKPLLQNSAGESFYRPDYYEQQYGYGQIQLSSHAVYEIAMLAALLGCVPLAYASGQLASMWFTSSLIAAVVAVVLAALASGWALLMHALHISWIWSVLPVLAGLLAATALRGKGWLVERYNARSWAAPVAALLLPALALAAAVPTYRECQIPQVEPVWPVGSEPAGDTAAGRQTLDLYLQAWDLTAAPWLHYQKGNGTAKDDNKTDPNPFDPPEPPKPDRVKMVAECREAIELALAASRRDECYFPFLPGDAYPTARPKVKQLGYLLLMSADVYGSEGKLDEARQAYWGALRISRHLMMRDWQADDSMWLASGVFDRLPYWAAHEGQTVARLRAAIAQLEQFESTLTPTVAVLQINYQGSTAIIDDLTEAAPWLYANTTVPPEAWIASRLPWERARARRLLNYATAHDLSLLETLESRLAKSDEVASLFPRRYFLGAPRDDQLAAWLGTTALFRGGPVGEQIAWNRVAAVDRYRIALSLLALEGWKLEHGSLPDRLDALVGSFLHELPVDPLAGAAYLYYPAGWPSELEMAHASDTSRLPAGRPFVWSVLPQNRWQVSVARQVSEDDQPDRAPQVRYCVLDLYGNPQSYSLAEVLRYGWPHVIP